MQTFGSYVVFQHLASGGMAELYLARDARDRKAPDQQLYVVKELSPRLADDPASVNMFLDETRLAGRLFHPNIVRVHASGHSAKHPYYTMEYLDGRDLVAIRRRLAQCGTAMPINAAIAIALQICRALAYAHNRRDPQGAPLGIVHRDVSPGNVLITVDGVAKLIDFGVALAEQRIEETRAGLIKGKLRYMSPEQALADHVDHRSDIFSLSAMLWELTVGRTLFDQKGDLEILRAIVYADAPRPSSLHPEFPSALEEIICKGLQRNADERYQSATAMAAALEDYAANTALDVSDAALAATIGRLFTNQPPEAAAPAADSGYDDVSFPDIEIVEEVPNLLAPFLSDPALRALFYASGLVGLAATAAVWL